MPNNYWDDLFQPDDTIQPNGGSVFDDLFSDDFGAQDTSGGLQMDEWNPEYQKQEGWGDLGEYLSGGNPIKDRGLEWSDTRNLIGPAGQLLFGNDNPINRLTGKVVSGVGDIVLSTAKSGADLFSYATEKVNSGLTSVAEDHGLLAPDVADKMRESFAGDRKEFNDLVKKPLGDAADLMGDITSDLSAKKDFGGGYMAEMGGNLDTLLESGSVKDAVSALWETAEDTGGMAMDVGAGMLSSAITGGPVGEISGLGSVGAGMALQAYSDTYDELTKNDGDSRALAVTVSAANAAVQGILEKIGWETALGKGPVAEWFEVNAKDTVLKSMLARSILTGPTEGSEEFLQEFTDILAKNLPNVKRDGWEATFTKIKEQAYNQMPESAFTGFAFGRLLGGAVAPMQNLAAKDIAARYGNLNVDPDRKLADSINQPTSDEKAKDALIDVVEKEGGLAGNGDLTGMFPVAVVDSNGNMVQNNIPEVSAKQEKVKKAAKNAKASKKAVDNAIKDLALEQEKQRAELGADLTSSDIDAAADRITKSIDTVVQEKQTQVDTLMGVVGSMTQLLQGTQPTFNTGAEGEQETVQAPQIQASQEEVSGVIQAKAQELGLEVPIEAIQNPIGFDWETWGQQQVAQAKESVVEGLKGPVDAIRSSITVEPDSPMASVLSSIPEPTVELPEPIYEDESVSSRILLFNQIKSKEAPVVPNTDNMADATAWNSDFGGLRRIAMSAKEGIALLPSEQNITDHKAVLDRILRIAPNMHGNETVAHLAGVYAGYMREALYAPGGNTRKATAAARVALAINREIRKQNIPGVNIMPTLVGAVPNIEATNRYTRNLQYGPERNNPQVFSGGASLGSWLIGASESVARGLGFDQEKVDRVTNNAKAMADQAAAAFAVAPQIKSIIFNVWQTAPKALVDRLGDAMRNGHDANANELATMVADHLASQGLYVDMPQLIESNPDAMIKFSSALVGVGKGIMSPWSMERVMLATGVEIRAAKAGVAALQSMAERWAMKNNGTVFEWWDRFGDYARVMEFADRTVLGTASADRLAKDRPLYGIQNALEYGKGMLRLFKSGEPLSVKTALHESIHMLYSSGLMGEMLDDEAKTAMEQLCGEKLWGANGQPLKISNLANEKMAVGFEKFMFENDAPNNRLRAAFEDAKQFFRNFVKYMFKDYKGPWNSHPDYNTIPIYGLKNADVYLEMGDLDISAPQVRAFYQLLNANPDGTEIAYSSPGIATAVENLITATTGIEAKGVLTYQPPAMSLVTLPVFPKDRVVTADDLPDAEDAANTKWFHGSKKNSLHETGFSSAFSQVGLVGTGVYLTDDPALAETYREYGTAQRSIVKRPFGFGDEDGGDVYAIKVEPRKVINLEKEIDPKAKFAVLDAVDKWIDSEYPDINMEDYANGSAAREKYKELALEKIKEVKAWVKWERYRSDNKYQEPKALTLVKDVMMVSKDERLFKMIERSLRAAGFDAYTHVGGKIMGNKDHRVLVLLDPQASGGSYPKTVEKAWPTTNIDPEKIEDDWSIHEPNGPSDSQWRRMIGLTNDESNGTHTHATLLEMAKNRERVTDLAKRTSAQKGMVPPAPLESRASVNREVLSAVGEGILEGEPLIEEMFKHLHDTVMNGGMDGHNSGVATDHTKVEQVKDMLTNFVSKMRSWAYLTAKGDIGRVGKELSRGALYALVKLMHVGAKAFEKAIGNYGADWSNLIRGLAKPTEAEIQRLRASGGEEAVKQRMAEYESMDMLSLAEFLNNNHALSKLADKVAELRPQLYDIVKHMAVPIPGARSFNEITTTFNRMAEAYYAANKHKLPFRDEHEFHGAVTRDLRLWMFSARQFELVDRVKEDMAKYEADVAAWEKSTATKKKKKPKKGDVMQELQQPEKPKKPKLPKITEEGTRWAESVKMLMEMRYGKNLAMFKATAQELTQWENHMVLDKLLNVGMITAKEHADMYSKGKHHIPMYRLRSMLDKSGALNTRLDDSMYKVLDYLKHDISMKMEDPINAMLRKAAGIEMLTMRQHAKNALGKRILADVRWWDIDYKDSPLSILSQKIAITKEEYDELSRTGQYKLTSAVKYKKDDQGNRMESGHTYYKHVPFTADDVESGLKYATNPSVLKALKKTESQVRSEYEQRMFAFYPEPGKPMYVSIHDPALAKAFFYMNNQQAVWANSVAGWMFSKIDSMAGAQEQAELQDKFLYHSARLAATGYFGMNKISKSFITAAPAFIYNTLFRDLPGAKIRSRTGLRWIDIPGGFMQSAALMFPSMMEVFPEKFDVARDASQGMATFSGLSASNADGSLDADVLMSLTRGRGEKLAKAKAGHYGALASLMWGDMKQFFAKEGLTTAPGQMWSELKRGKNVGKHFIAMGLSPFTVARAAGQFAGSIIENATRLTERGLMMSEDMSKYPSLVAHYDPKKAINGKILAGTTGTIHRAKWEMAKSKLKMDPNYKVPEDAMPIQSNLTERDNAMSHVTVHFPQKGYWTASMDQLSMFYNPMAQDFYTNMMILTRHSALQKATAYALGENWEAAKDQVKLDSAAYAWVMKSLFYVTLPMMMMMASYGGDDDDSQDWQSQSFIEKSSYFWIPTNKLGLTERPLRVASGLGLFSLMFKDLPMAGMLEMQGKDPKAMHKWMRRFFDSTPFGAVGIPAMDYEQYGWKPALMSFNTKTVPWLAPESINPWLELGFDRQQFRDKAIAFPQELAREDPTEVQREKYNMLTNAITKAFSSARMQPAQVQYLISRYFTGSNRWLPVVANKAMELSTGAEGVPEDVQSSNSPLANQSSGWAPRIQAREAYGMGSEFVQDLLTTARESAEQRKSYESMNTTRKPSYLAENKLIQEDIYFGKRGQDGYRSGGLQAAAKKVIEWERSKKEALKAGRIDKVEALLIEKQYTLFAMEAMRNVMFQLGE